ncbi:MAG: hydantoinase B/oxoprolinase family protein [Alphaproteobacteria bacterium]|nr:hydantoinase B/oxoprolinase family protein [Alphaproteobacteria bacterium]
MSGRDEDHGVDPVTTEIVRNGVIAVTEEMKTNLMRTAYNMIIYEALDFTVGLFTAKGETVSIGLGLPTFIRGMGETVRQKLAKFGTDGIAPGDILVTNDAYITGSHLNHITMTLPIFDGEVLVGFACCMAHWPDVGGTLGGMTTDIYSEGLQIPILKAYRAGVPNQDLIDIIRNNVRLPDRAMGDWRAQLTAIKTGERRFLELVRRYGRQSVLGGISRIMDLSEAAARARTRTIPDGVYEAESFMDDDGVDVGKPIPIRVKVTVEDDTMTIDLTEVSRQVRGFYNSGLTTGFSCTQVAYKCMTSPTDYPINDGSFRSLTSIVPKGRIVSAVKPAPMRWWMTFPMTIIDTVFKALAPAIPDRVAAGHHADLIIGNINGILPKERRFYLGIMGPQGGGWGAKLTEDGLSATVCLNDGDTHNGPVEQVEAKYPIIIERHALIQDSGGAGRHRGGLGIEKIVESRAPMNFGTQVDRVHCPPWGLAGGLAGFGNKVRLRRAGKEPEDFSNAKVLAAVLREGDATILCSGGGGGFGPPHERPAAHVAEDVRQGYVSIEAAARDYGVIVDPETFAVDEAATAARRAVLAAAPQRSAGA